MIRNLTLLFFLATAGLFAQPTIPQISLNAGDALVLDITFPITAAGPGGPNAVWDFSTAAFSGAEFPYTAQTAASTPYAAQFPDATMALFTDMSYEFSGYFYFNFTGGFTELGNVFIDNFDVEQNIYTDPLTFYTTPLNISSSGSDTFSSLSETVYGDVQTSGTHTWTVDGYGTLKLPNATYTDVLRIHAVQDQELTIIWSGEPMFTTPVSREEWRWVKAGIPYPLLVFSLDTEDGETEVSSQAALVSYNGSTGMDDLMELPMRVYPNPVRDVVTIDLEASGKVQYRVLDALGSEVLQGEISASGTLRQSVSVATLNAGLYQLEVRSADGVATESLIIE